jgi:hypothetical protein
VLGLYFEENTNPDVYVIVEARRHTANEEELAGDLGRTGIRRILGTQAPDVNNGQPVTSTLTLAPFDAIILLADSIPSQ